MQTFMDVFTHAPWYGTIVMLLLFAGAIVELWIWYRAPKRNHPRDPAWLKRAAILAVLFAISFAYYYKQLPTITSQ